MAKGKMPGGYRTMNFSKNQIIGCLILLAAILFLSLIRLLYA